MDISPAMVINPPASSMVCAPVWLSSNATHSHQQHAPAPTETRDWRNEALYDIMGNGPTG
jgi:hypothetical protein